MAYEWVGTVATAVLGLAGIAATVLVSKSQQDNSREMAREAREQDRLADAYLRLLVLAERFGQWAQTVNPMSGTYPPQPVRPLPGLDERAEAEAVVNAFGSDQARRAFDAWRDVVRDIIAAVNDLEREARRRNDDVDFGDPDLRLRDLRPAEHTAREALSQQVNKELRPAR